MLSTNHRVHFEKLNKMSQYTKPLTFYGNQCIGLLVYTFC